MLKKTTSGNIVDTAKEKQAGKERKGKNEFQHRRYLLIFLF